MYVPKPVCLELHKVEFTFGIENTRKWTQYGSMELEGFARNKSYQYYWYLKVFAPHIPLPLEKTCLKRHQSLQSPPPPGQIGVIVFSVESVTSFHNSSSRLSKTNASEGLGWRAGWFIICLPLLTFRRYKYWCPNSSQNPISPCDVSQNDSSPKDISQKAHFTEYPTHQKTFHRKPFSQTAHFTEFNQF